MCMLSHHIGAVALGGAHFGEGTGRIFLAYVECTGDESRLIDCPPQTIGGGDCEHLDDVGVECVRRGKLFSSLLVGMCPNMVKIR